MYNYATCPRSSMDRVPDFESDGWGGSSPSAGIFFMFFYSLENVKHGLITMFMAYTEHLTLNLKLLLCS